MTAHPTTASIFVLRCTRLTLASSWSTSHETGHHKAMMTGLGQARGDLVFLIDSDLEEPPSFVRFHDRLSEGDWRRCIWRAGNAKGQFPRAYDRHHVPFCRRRVERSSSSAQSGDGTPDDARLCPRPRPASGSRVPHLDLWQQSGYRQVALPVEKLSLSPTTYSLARRVHWQSSTSRQPRRSCFTLSSTAASRCAACR